MLHERRVEHLLDLRDRAAVYNVLKVECRRVAFDERRRSLFCLRSAALLTLGGGAPIHKSQ